MIIPNIWDTNKNIKKSFVIMQNYFTFVEIFMEYEKYQRRAN